MVPRRRVGITLLGQSTWRIGGAGVYTRGLVEALVRRQVHDYVLFVPPAASPEWRRTGATVVACGPDPDQRVSRVLYELIRLPALAKRQQVESMLFPLATAPQWCAGQCVVMLYDLLLMARRTDFPWYKVAYLRWVYSRLASGRQRIVTISEFSRREVIRMLGIDQERVTVAPPGLDAEFTVPPAGSIATAYGFTMPYLVSVAATYPHKRLEIVIEAFEEIAREKPDLALVLAGTHPGAGGSAVKLRVRIESSPMRDRILQLPPLPRSQVAALMADAEALVSASDYEGFGMPVVEAMAVGCPVAASPAAAVCEALGGWGWIAENTSMPALVAAIRQALEARTRSTRVLLEARDRALNVYTWDRAAAAVEVALSAPLNAEA